MVDPISGAIIVGEFLAKTFAGRKIHQWLVGGERRNAFKKAMEAALDQVIEEGFDPKGPGALDVSFLGSEGVWEELWTKLLDPTVDEEINYDRLGQELNKIYPDTPISPKEIEAIEFFVDILMDKALYRPCLHDIINLKIQRQHDLRLTLAKKKALVKDYLREEGKVMKKLLDEDIGEGNRYIDPLIEKREVKKPDVIPTGKQTDSFIPVDMNTYFMRGSDHRVVVVADSGYGKTTLLRELFLRISKGIESDPFRGNSCIPVYFTPSQAAECSEATVSGKLTARLMASGCREGKVRQFVQDEFGKGRFILLIDALDQVSNREDLRGALEGRAFRNNRVVITTRPNVWEMEKGHLREYTYVRIREFDESRWEEYLNEYEPDALGGIVDEDFLSVPILLKLIVESWVRGMEDFALVKNRAGLFDKMFDKLLKRQEEIDSAEAETQKKRALPYIKRDLHKLAHDTLAMKRLGQFPRCEALEEILDEDTLNDLEARRWIFETTESGNELAFRHRSFQEYLAAAYIRSQIETEDDLKKLDPYLYHPQWEESMKFLVGLLPIREAKCLIDRILNLAKGRPLFLYRDHLRLAALCLKEIGEAGQSQRDALIKHLAQDIRNPTLQWTAVSIIATLKDRKGVGLLSSLLVHKDPYIRRNAVDALGEIKSDKALEPLIQALQDEDPYVRSGATDALGEIKSDKALEPLIQALQDEDPCVRSGATDALSKIKSDKAVKLLLQALRDEDPDIRGNAADALGNIKSEKAAEFLIQALHDKHTYVRRRAADALGKIKSDKAVEPLIQALQDKDSEVEDEATNALGKIKSEKAAEFLIQALHDTDTCVRRKATDALGKIKSDKAEELLIQALQDEDADIRGNAADALGKIKSDKAVEPLIQALQDEDSEVRWKAVEALGIIKSDKAVEPLIQALKDEDFNVRRRASDALWEIKSDKAVEPLVQALQDEDSFVRRSAADALGKIKSDKTVEPLIQALQDKDFDVRRRAADALVKIKSDKVVELLIQALKHRDFDVRWRATDALGKIKSDKAVEPLIQALKDEDPYVRGSAVDSLGEIESDEAVEPLIQTLHDKDTYVRKRVADALGKMKSDNAVDALIQALRDEDSFVRCCAADALGKIKSDKAVGPLIQTLQDEDVGVRGSVTKALGEIKSDKAVKPLIQALQDEECFFKGKATDALANIKSDKVVELLIQALKHRHHKDLDFLWSAIFIFGKAKSDKAVKLLLQALRDEDPRLRAAAAYGLGEIQSDEAVEPLIHALEDEDVDVRISAMGALGRIKSEYALEKLVNIWNQKDLTLDRSSLLHAIKSCDLNIRRQQPIKTADIQ